MNNHKAVFGAILGAVGLGSVVFGVATLENRAANKRVAEFKRCTTIENDNYKATPLNGFAVQIEVPYYSKAILDTRDMTLAVDGSRYDLDRNQNLDVNDPLWAVKYDAPSKSELAADDVRRRLLKCNY